MVLVFVIGVAVLLSGLAARSVLSTSLLSLMGTDFNRKGKLTVAGGSLPPGM